jgi:hypothetical protein
MSRDFDFIFTADPEQIADRLPAAILDTPLSAEQSAFLQLYAVTIAQPNCMQPCCGHRKELG